MAVKPLPTIIVHGASLNPIRLNGCAECEYWLPPNHTERRGAYCKLAANDVCMISECSRRDATPEPPVLSAVDKTHWHYVSWRLDNGNVIITGNFPPGSMFVLASTPCRARSTADLYFWDAINHRWLTGGDFDKPVTREDDIPYAWAFPPRCAPQQPTSGEVIQTTIFNPNKR